MQNRLIRVSLLAAAAAVSVSSYARATIFHTVVVPAWRGSALTTYQEWDGFTSTTNPNAATTAANAFGTPDAYDGAAATDGSFLIGSPGDIYSFSGVINPTMTIPTSNIAGNQLNVQVEMQWDGSPITGSDLTVNGTPATSLANYSYTEVYNDGGSEFGGFGTAYLADDVWTFSLPDTPLLQLSFGWDAVDSAWQVASVDTQSVIPAPEPASLGLLALAAAILPRRRCRH